LYRVDWDVLPVERDPTAQREALWLDSWEDEWRERMQLSLAGEHECATTYPGSYGYECEFCSGFVIDPRALREMTLPNGEMYLVCRDCADYIKRDMPIHEEQPTLALYP